MTKTHAEYLRECEYLKSAVITRDDWGKRITRDLLARNLGLEKNQIAQIQLIDEPGSTGLSGFEGTGFTRLAAIGPRGLLAVGYRCESESCRAEILGPPRVKLLVDDRTQMVAKQGIELYCHACNALLQSKVTSLRRPYKP